VNVGVSGLLQFVHVDPLQHLLSLARRTVRLTLATPESASSALPQMSATLAVPQPPFQAAPLL
jgi:hypothetical protein